MSEDLQQTDGGGPISPKEVKFREISTSKMEESNRTSFSKKSMRFSFRLSRKSRASRDLESDQDQDDRRPSKFLRQDSAIIKVKPGQCFSPYADIVVASMQKCDPKLGTLGEFRHQLQTGTKQQIKKFIRHNDWTMQHRIRSELWKELCRRDGAALDAHITVYKETASRLSESMSSLPQPTFLSSPGVVQSNHLLKDNGKRVVLKVLATLEHLRPDFTKIPILYPLTAALLHYMEEEEVYACLVKMVEQNQKYLLQTDIAYAASKRTLLMLIKRHLGRAYAMLKKLVPGDDSELLSLFQEWHSWIFRDLPFPHLVRVIDCFMYEGQKVLYRVAMGIIFLWRKESRKSLKGREGLTGEVLSNEISEFCKAIPSSPDHLLKTAFGIRNLSMSKIRTLQEAYEMEERRKDPKRGSAGTELSFKKQSVIVSRLSDVTVESKILSPDQVSTIVNWLPPRIQLLTPFRLFSLRTEGTSFTRLWQKIDEAERTVFVILTSNNEIFGAYCSSEWAARRSGRSAFFGTGETFLFRLTPTPEKFEWVGIENTVVKHSQELFMAATATSLTIGGGGSGQGLSIREELVGGDTSPCDTFDNKPLVDSGTFDIRDMEVFTLATEIEE